MKWFARLSTAVVLFAAGTLFSLIGNQKIAWSQSSGPIYCGNSAFVDAPSSSPAALVAVPAGTTKIFVCGYAILNTNGAAANAIGLIYGTSTACTGATKVTPAWNFGANGGLAENYPTYSGILIPAGNGLCATAGTPLSAQVRVSYALIF